MSKETTVLSAGQFGKMLAKGKLVAMRAGRAVFTLKGTTYSIPLSAMLAEVEGDDDEKPAKKSGRKTKGEKAEKPAKKSGRKAKGEKAEKPAKKSGRKAKGDDGDVQAAVLAALKEADGPVGMGALKDATDLNPIHIRAALNEMLEAGTVKKEGEKRGTVYTLGGKKAKKVKKEEDEVEEEEEEKKPRRKKDKKDKKGKKRKHRDVEEDGEEEDKPRKKKDKKDKKGKKNKRSAKVDLPWGDDEGEETDFDTVE